MDGEGAPVVISPGFRWTALPYARNRARGHLALGAVVLAGLLLALALHSVLAGGFAVVLLLASTLSYFVPTGYEITAEGLAVERLGQRTVWKWADFRSVVRQGDRMWLSRYPGDSVTARIRSVRADLPGQGDEVYEYVRQRIEVRR